MGRVVMCDHTYCYTPAVQYIREAIASGEVGDLQFIDSVRINLGLVQRDIDVVFDLATHDLSIIDAIIPADDRVCSISATGAIRSALVRPVSPISRSSWSAAPSPMCTSTG